MKVDQESFDALMVSNDEKTLGFCITLKTGNSEGLGKEKSQCFIVDDGVIKEIGRMVGYMINLLTANEHVTADEAGTFRLLWRKIIKS